MGKFTFKMKDRMKIVIDRPAVNSCTLTISGKNDTVFSFSKRRAGELTDKVISVLTYGTPATFRFRKTVKSPAGYIVIEQPTTCVDAYSITVCEDEKQIFFENSIPRKTLKKMMKTMREVWGIEDKVH